MRLWVYIVRRVLLLLPVIIGVLTIQFLLISALPIQDRISSEIGPSHSGFSLLPGSPAYNRSLVRLGLNQPVQVQWAIYVYRGLTLQWGYTDPGSFANTALGLHGVYPVASVLSWYLPYTLQLAAIALALTVLLSFWLGNWAAANQNRGLDQATRLFAFSGWALPAFLLAPLILFLGIDVAGGLGATYCHGTTSVYFQFVYSWPQPSCYPQILTEPWIGPHFQTSPTGFPALDAMIHGNWYLAGDSLFRDLLPAISIAYLDLAGILWYVRNSMLEVLRADYVRTARAKGVPESRVVRRHAGRNSLMVTLAVIGLTFAGFVGGFPVIEEIFQLRGVGLVLVDAVLPVFDYGLIFGSTLLFTILVVGANICVDVAQAILDPRIRVG